MNRDISQATAANCSESKRVYGWAETHATLYHFTGLGQYLPIQSPCGDCEYWFQVSTEDKHSGLIDSTYEQDR